MVAISAGDGDSLVRARVHDRKSPTPDAEWQSVEARYDVGSERRSTPMTWYGGYLWRAVVPADAGAIEVCATDARGNAACAPAEDREEQQSDPGGA
jgi:hypothetical protein